ncbi:uncharacterized protein AMSG_02675 [Thecamonas trahens ATCC 50062]|uniref:Uncharacterized protein n=1 Tax=Thecamonas trahens ATCC 50062 TaxID=461836 RepID=A0A0L0D1J0_THETB|nr:hypothetical protein AMSG_02675 [Thecamonas trahens ATCC 50062]KNC46224.1 hypothetical protein AMSG_02675 [Thecamonas trahens ATCC 50062]|eukprot:XP_013760521.1 hypothetical protein AMSG_02675 [Thecamonas trahens ATCC 50062]
MWTIWSLRASNPCTTCNNVTRQCVNPDPLCGSFCGGFDGACVVDNEPGAPCAAVPGTSITCCACHSDWAKGCVPGSSPPPPPPPALPVCGTICSSSGECEASETCPSCVAYHCAHNASCGQVCISSGECASNPPSCRHCVYNQCSEGLACGASCASSQQCKDSCPVCGHIATCVSSEAWRATVDAATASGTLAELHAARAAALAAAAAGTP